MIIAALLLGLATPVSAGEVFDLMTDSQREISHKMCANALDAFIRGDKTYLQRTFDAAETPAVIRLAVTKLCITYSAGVQKGLKLSEGIQR